MRHIIKTSEGTKLFHFLTFMYISVTDDATLYKLDNVMHIQMLYQM